MITPAHDYQFPAESADIIPHVTVKRCHGLGNVLCLLPVLDRLHDEGYRLGVVTRSEWVHAFSILRPHYSWTVDSADEIIDLDEMTEKRHPREHRTDEFARLLGMGRPFSPPRLHIPSVWLKPFESLKDCILFAPESGHPSRQWPHKQANLLKNFLPDEKLVLIGTRREPPIACDLDLRAQLDLHELFGILQQAGTVITMDSAVLHLAAALGVPTIAIFGGINPSFRIRPEQRVIVLLAQMECCPCNKNETCAGGYPCIAAAHPEKVVKTIPLARQTKRFQLVQITPTPRRTLLAS